MRMSLGKWQVFWHSEPFDRFYNRGTLRGLAINADWWRFGRLEIRKSIA